MGLSTKQVSSDGHGWNQALLQAGALELPKPPMKRQPLQQQQQQSEPLNCPRCDSTNTKFCYYNNYNKSQPRHFCKTCKRHWTKGGTLRNVPVGGGRKNKRKTSNAAGKTASKVSSATTSAVTTTISTVQGQQPRLSFPLAAVGGIDEKNLSETFYQTVGRQTPSSMPNSLNNSNDGVFLGSTLSVTQNDQDPQFPYSNLGGFENNPCSISSTISSTISSIQFPNLYNYTGDSNPLEETVMNSSSSMSDHHLPWSMSTTTSSVMDMSSNWGWDDFDKFVSVEADLTIPWDDTDIKPN